MDASCFWVRNVKNQIKIKTNWMFVKIDKSCWPVVAIRFEEHPKDEQEFDQFLNSIEELYSKEEPIWFIFETVGIGLNPKYISKMIKFMNENDNLTKQFMQKCAVIVSKDSVRIVINFILTVAKPSGDIQCFSDFDKGWSWLISN